MNNLAYLDKGQSFLLLSEWYALGRGSAIAPHSYSLSSQSGRPDEMVNRMFASPLLIPTIES